MIVNLKPTKIKPPRESQNQAFKNDFIGAKLLKKKPSKMKKITVLFHYWKRKSESS